MNYFPESAGCQKKIKIPVEIEGFSLTLSIVDSDDHGESRAQGYDPGDRAGPGSLALLDLHPTVHIIAWQKISER